MLPMNAKPVEAYIDPVDLSQLLDDRFFGILSRRLPGIRAAAITLVHETSGKDVHGEQKVSAITIWYPERPRAGKPAESVSIDTSSEEDLQATLSAMDEFLSRKE